MRIGGGYRYRYRLTATVRLGNELRVGAGVQEFRYHEQAIEIIDTSRRKIVGEAVIVDLSPIGLLFLTLAEWGRDSQDGQLYVRSDYWDVDRYLKDHLGNSVDAWPPRSAEAYLAPRDLPATVMFQDTESPSSVFYVDPADISASLGPNVAFESVKCEITSDRFSKGVVTDVLPWLPDYKRRHVNLNNTVTTYGGSPAAYLTPSAFY